jgi:hypothetical protein
MRMLIAQEAGAVKEARLSRQMLFFFSPAPSFGMKKRVTREIKWEVFLNVGKDCVPRSFMT